jgi:hypothetical protein
MRKPKIESRLAGAINWDAFSGGRGTLAKGQFREEFQACEDGSDNLIL